MNLVLELDPKWVRRIPANFLDALRRAARAESLEVAEAIIRKSAVGGQAIVSRSTKQLSVCCTTELAGVVRCAVIFYAAPHPVETRSGGGTARRTDTR